MDYSDKVGKAIQHFWKVRSKQYQDQGAGSGVKDHGSRAAVTGGKHLHGFIDLFAELLSEAGLPDSTIHTKKTTLPGYFRATKKWDLVVVVDDLLLASIEFKAHVGSLGNNQNNRVEEALGNATDILTAYREGKFKPSAKPWLGWLMLFEDSPQSRAGGKKVLEPHFDVFPEFKDAPYTKRYELLCERLMRERLYDATCLLLSNETIGLKGGYSEPSEEIGFRTFATSLIAHATAFSNMRRG